MVIDPARIGTAAGSRQQRRRETAAREAMAQVDAAVAAAARVQAELTVTLTQRDRDAAAVRRRRRERRQRDADWGAIVAFAATPRQLVQFDELAATVRAVCRWLVAEEQRDGTE